MHRNLVTEGVILCTESVFTLKGTKLLKTTFIGSSTYNIIQNVSGAFVISKECLDGIVLSLQKNWQQWREYSQQGLHKTNSHVMLKSLSLLLYLMTTTSIFKKNASSSSQLLTEGNILNTAIKSSGLKITHFTTHSCKPC